MTRSFPEIFRNKRREAPDDIVGPVGMVLRLHEKAPIGGDAADRRQMIAGQLHAQYRCLTAWGVGADRHGE